MQASTQEPIITYWNYVSNSQINTSKTEAKKGSEHRKDNDDILDDNRWKKKI